MLDIAFVRSSPAVVKKAAEDKGVTVDVEEILRLDAQRRTLQAQIDAVAGKRKARAREVQGKPAVADIAEGRQLKQELAGLERTLREIELPFMQLLRALPNIPSADTPVGKDEGGNVILRASGDKPTLDFTPQPHWELGKALDIIDNEQAAIVSGSRFTYLKGELAWLQFALIQLALAVLTDEKQLASIARASGLNVSLAPFVPVIPPVFIKPEVMERMARLEPREERYHTETDDLYLVGSAEHTLGPLHIDETFREDALPVRYVGYSTAFRREAGSHGKDIRGILRLHQFDKIEIESFTLPELSLTEQDFIVAIQEHLMQTLGLPYHVVLKCTADMGTPNARAIDLETWMPGQNTYRETHTSDLMTDFQARRLGTRVQRGSGTKEYVHMNDATVFAIGRTLIAIMENYQRADGSIGVPKALQQYVPFTEIHR